MEETKKKKSRWGLGIFLLYSGFVLFIVSFVVFALNQEFFLVEDNYYQKALHYQDKIESLKNTENLSIKPFLGTDKEKQLVTIRFPDSLAQLGIAGTAHFFRPSDKRADQILPLVLDNSNQMTIQTIRFLKGYWILKLSWESGGVSYYQEEKLYI